LFIVGEIRLMLDFDNILQEAHRPWLN